MFPVGVPTGAWMSRGLEEAARRFADHDALRFGDDRLSFGELDRLSNAFAGRAAGAAGSRPASGSR